MLEDLTQVTLRPGFWNDNDKAQSVLRKRAAVERKIADLINHGLRRARYLGRAKVRIQNYWTGAVVNLKRLFALFKGDTGAMRQGLNALNMA